MAERGEEETALEREDVRRFGDRSAEEVIGCLRDLLRYAPSAHQWGIHVAIRRLSARPEGEDARRMDESELRATFQDLAERITHRDSMSGTITYEASEEPGVYLVRGAYRVGNSMGQGGWRILSSTPTRSERDDRSPHAPDPADGR